MAGRPQKSRIDYAGWDVNLFNDPKVYKLIDGQGWNGWSIYFYICNLAYGSDGYFYQWNDDDSPAFIAHRMSGGIRSKTVLNTVRLCSRIGLFDKNLYERHKILTSRAIQKQYRIVAITRVGNSVIKEYWLLKNKESAGLVFHTLDSDFDQSKLNYDHPKLNYDPPIVEYRIVEDRIVHNTDACAREEPSAMFEEFFSVYPDSQYGKPRQPTERAYLDVLAMGVSGNSIVSAAKNYAEYCVITETKVRRSDNFFKNCFFEMYLPENYKKPPKPSGKAKNGFAEFQQNQYDYGALENELLAN